MPRQTQTANKPLQCAMKTWKTSKMPQIPRFSAHKPPFIPIENESPIAGETIRRETSFYTIKYR